jgi:hypothetical protein
MNNNTPNKAARYLLERKLESKTFRLLLRAGIFRLSGPHFVSSSNGMKRWVKDALETLLVSFPRPTRFAWQGEKVGVRPKPVGQ